MLLGQEGQLFHCSKNIEQKSDHLPITDKRMTRFWITLKQGVEFVIKCFDRMHGGEIFIPMIPSIYITDLATAMAPNLKQKIVGIRPGEKIHEIMCPSDDSHLTLKFNDHFVITPSIDLDIGKNEFVKNALNEVGEAVELDFEYSSRVNEDFLNIDQIKGLLD